MHPISLEHSELLKELKSKLKNLYEKRAECAKIRSRAKEVEEGEKPTKYFF